MQFRHEWKHEINYGDLLEIRQRMRAIGKPDENTIDGKYKIRSLYFDTLSDKALREKLDGISHREKFRIRYYNDNTENINLEKKSKISGLGTKEIVAISPKEAQAIVDGNLDWMIHCDRPLVQELYTKMKLQGLRPKTIVDYTREPFTYAPGNVRVTLDYNIRTGLSCTKLLDPDCITVPVEGSPIILEVKWDAFLPEVIREAVQLRNRQTGSFSKYAVCRMYD